LAKLAQYNALYKALLSPFVTKRQREVDDKGSEDENLRDAMVMSMIDERWQFLKPMLRNLLTWIIIRWMDLARFTKHQQK
jgi:hypothetical protein